MPLRNTWQVIVDFHGVSINEGRRMVGLIGKASGQAQANSPEYLSKMFIVNFPRWLTALYTTGAAALVASAADADAGDDPDLIPNTIQLSSHS